MRLGAIKQEISRLVKDIHDLEQSSPEEGQAKLLAARERLEALQEEEKRIHVEWERLRERG